MNKERLYRITERQWDREHLLATLREHPEIRFVSLVAVDLAGNDTDERIPMQVFLEDVDAFLAGKAVQTDGSSVVLAGMASLDDAQVDLLPDLHAPWYVDYNAESQDPETGLPVGTLRIPSFLVHRGERVDARSLLSAALAVVRSELLDLLHRHAAAAPLAHLGLAQLSDITVTVGTELEFWVKTPMETANVDELSAAQILQENYWQRTRGAARTALEQSVLALEAYGLHPEMGHKEVGGVKAAMGRGGELTHVMEQMELDWRYAPALQAADNELLARILVRETFRSCGLQVNFKAKPIPDVAGSGEHTHLGMNGTLADGSHVNLFSPADPHAEFLSTIGYGALMGLLRNYEVVGPFITATNDAFNRLKPGYEAPVCTVASLGRNPAVPSRNRTVLAGLVRDLENPLATRFELRAPNPYTNTYLAVAAASLAMLDGIRWAITAEASPQELLTELSKQAGAPSHYLEQERAYRAEENVFEKYTQEERDRLFGRPPATVWETMQSFAQYPDRTAVLQDGGVLTPRVIAAFRTAALARWKHELLGRILPEDLSFIAGCRKREDLAGSRAADLWKEIDALRRDLADDSDHPSLCSRLAQALLEDRGEEASQLQQTVAEQLGRLRHLDDAYRRLIF